MRQGVSVVAAGLVVAAVTAGCGGVKLVVNRVCASGPSLGSAATVAHPLPCFAKRTTLARAAASSGVPLVLPETALVRPSDVRRVWIDGFFDRPGGRKSIGTVAVTFPSQGLIVEYTRPAPLRGDTRTHYRQVALGFRDSKVIDLKRRPALVFRQNSDGTRNNFGSVSFKLNGSEVRILGHKSEATLEGLALSILNQSSGSRTNP